MLERGGHLHEDSGVNERRDRAEVELGKGKCRESSLEGWQWRKRWRLRIE